MKTIDIMPGTKIEKAMMILWRAWHDVRYREAVMMQFNDAFIMIAPSKEEMPGKVKKL